MPPKRRSKKKAPPPSEDAGNNPFNIADCLKTLTIDASTLEGCDTRDKEYLKIKKIYHKLCLANHPDKGGDAAVFRGINEAWEYVKELRSQKANEEWTFVECLSDSKSTKKNDIDLSNFEFDFSAMPTPSWEYYATAESEEEPIYRVELAKSGRSKCKATGKYKYCSMSGQEQVQHEIDEKEKEAAEAAKSEAEESSGGKKKGKGKKKAAKGKAKGKTATGKGKGKGKKKKTDINDDVEAEPTAEAKAAAKSTTTAKSEPMSLDNSMELTTAPGSSLATAGHAPELIAKGEIRVGSNNQQTGTYGRWKHLRCFRVPHKVWLGLPDPEECDDDQAFATALENMNDVLLSGFSELPKEEQMMLVKHCMDKTNWARGTKKVQAVHDATVVAAAMKPVESESTAEVPQSVKKEPPVVCDDAKPAPDGPTSLVASAPSALASAGVEFVIPRPSLDGASSNTVFKGQTFVLTGLFPEVGGGGGLSVGKDKVKAMIESFGGCVTGSISGKTTVLVVGKEPGMSKVSKARAKGILFASLHDLKVGLDEGLEALEDFEASKREAPMKIQSFSAGYMVSNKKGFNGLALKASAKELALAQGIIKPKDDVMALEADKPAALALEDSKPPVLELEEAKPAAKKRGAKKKQKAKKASAKKNVDKHGKDEKAVYEAPSTTTEKKKRKVSYEPDDISALEPPEKSSKKSPTVKNESGGVASDDNTAEPIVTMDEN